MIFKNYLKDPLATIAVNTTIFIAGCLFFGSIALIGIFSELIRANDPNLAVREQHVQQHHEEHLKYDQMITLLDAINSKLESKE